MWRHSCFPFLLTLFLDSLKKLRSYFNGALPSSHSSTASTTETSSEPGSTEKHQEVEDDDELFEINLDAVGKKGDDNSAVSSPVTIRFANNNQVLLANRLSNALELSAAIPVADEAPMRARVPAEVMARWVLGGECEKAKSSSFRELTSTIKQLMCLKILTVSGRNLEDDSSSNRWGRDLGFKVEELFGDNTRRTKWEAM